MSSTSLIPDNWHWCNNRHHLVKEFTDGDTSLVVSKYWSKGRWKYEVTEKWLIEYQLELSSKNE